MHNRTDRLLLLGLGASIGALILLLLWDPPLSLSSLRASLLFSLPAVPFFCLQSLLIRLNRSRLRWVPLLLLLAAAAVGGAYFPGLAGDGWDSLGGALLLCLCIAPAAGCALGWMVSRHRMVRAAATLALALLLAVWLVLKGLGSGPVWQFEPLDAAAPAVLAAGLLLLFRGRHSHRT